MIEWKDILIRKEVNLHRDIILKILVYFEEFQYINDAITREKQLKNWHRQWKINLIEESNPNWENLWKSLDPETSSG
jgi:putative endonuclease